MQRRSDIFPRMRPMLEATPFAETSPSVVTGAGGDPRAEAKEKSVTCKMRPNDSKPRGDRNVFTHFPEGSEW